MLNTRLAGRLAAAFIGLWVHGYAVAEGVHFTYLWHLEQPVYWPTRQTGGADRYERAWESIQRRDAGRANPADNLRDIFGLPDRVAAYQYRPRDTINDLRSWAEAGAQVSYSGGLIENIMSLGAAGQLGYGSGWNAPFREARGWSTIGGKPRLDVVLFSFHHALLPLLDDSAVRKEIQLYKEIYADAWGLATGRSRGLFPSEMSFSTRLIPILAQEGVNWVIVSNEHLSRACADFPVVFGSGGINCDPPNRADQRNPAQGTYLRTSISRGCAPANATPFAYTPHYARQLDPATGQEYRVIVVPADQALSWKDGYAPLGVGEFAPLQASNPPARPQLVLLAHDGDNAWGGGFSYYREAVPNFVAAAQGAGYVATTIEQYLLNHPVPAGDVVHVEDGAWVNADGDFGAPQFINWNWPLLSATGQIDVAGGWHVDARNWAVITAAQNRIDTAEQIAGGVNIRKILYPDVTTTAAERAWHYFLAGLNSGFMYYGTALDHEVKQTLACNQAVQYADSVIGAGSADQTPPTIWIPQRHPWNPGCTNFGPQYGYRSQASNGDFWVWTFVNDVSGVSSVTLKYRLDDDAVVADANDLYAGGSGVGPWQSAAMTRRVFPAGNIYGDPSIDFFLTPTYIADQYYHQVTGIRSRLVDYYVEAVDARGHVRRSPIQHVYVGDGGGGGTGGDRVSWTPNPARAGQTVLLQYNAAVGPLAGSLQIYAHVGFDRWATVVSPDLLMTYRAATGLHELTISVPTSATWVDVAFRDAQERWDNNGGQDWHVTVTGTSQPAWVMNGQLDASARPVAQNGAYQTWAERRGDLLYIAGTGARAGNDHFLFLAGAPGAQRAAPWAKAGTVANWSAFLAEESDSGWNGWFDAAAGAATQSATGRATGVLEGVINLRAELALGPGAALPDAVWLALGVYASPDGGALRFGLQVPASTDSDTLLEAAEYARVVLALRGDADCSGAVDFDDIEAFIAALVSPPDYAAQYPTCPPEHTDVDRSGAVDFNDIGPFVECLAGACP